MGRLDMTKSNFIQEKYSKHIDICYYYIRDLIEDK